MSWHPRLEGRLLTGSEDTTICEWDITGYTKERRTMTPKRTYTGHSAWVEVRSGVILRIFAWRAKATRLLRMLLGLNYAKRYSLLWEMTRSL